MFNEVISSTITILKFELVKAIYETAIMLGISFVFSLTFGSVFGFLLYLTSNKAFFEKPVINKIIAGVINFIRSVPFIILVVFTLPFTFSLVGTKIGPVAASVPLSITATVL